MWWWCLALAPALVPAPEARCASTPELEGLRVVDATDCADPMTLVRAPCISAWANASNAVSASSDHSWAVCSARFPTLPPPLSASCASYQPPLGAIASLIVALPIAVAIDSYSLTRTTGLPLALGDGPSAWSLRALDPAGAEKLTDAEILSVLPKSWIPVDNRTAQRVGGANGTSTYELLTPVYSRVFKLDFLAVASERSVMQLGRFALRACIASATPAVALEPAAAPGDGGAVDAVVAAAAAAGRPCEATSHAHCRALPCEWSQATTSGLDGSGPNAGPERMATVLDGSVLTAWVSVRYVSRSASLRACVARRSSRRSEAAAHSRTPCNPLVRSERPTLVVELAQPTALSSYVLTSAKDHPSRDPARWTTEGLLAVGGGRGGETSDAVVSATSPAAAAAAAAAAVVQEQRWLLLDAPAAPPSARSGDPATFFTGRFQSVEFPVANTSAAQGERPRLFTALRWTFQGTVGQRAEALKADTGFQLGGVEVWGCENATRRALDAHAAAAPLAPTAAPTEAPRAAPRPEPPRNLRAQSAGDGALLVEWDTSLAVAEDADAAVHGEGEAQRSGNRTSVHTLTARPVVPGTGATRIVAVESTGGVSVSRVVMRGLQNGVAYWVAGRTSLPVANVSSAETLRSAASIATPRELDLCAPCKTHSWLHGGGSTAASDAAALRISAAAALQLLQRGPGAARRLDTVESELVIAGDVAGDVAGDPAAAATVAPSAAPNPSGDRACITQQCAGHGVCMPFGGERAECVCHTAWEGVECDGNVAASSTFFSHPLRWQVSGWTSCSESCGVRGVRQRDVWCERVAPSAQADSVVVVGNDHCNEIGSAPAKQEPCRVVACDARIVTVVLRLRLVR